MSQKKNKVIDFGYKEISIDKKKHLVSIKKTFSLNLEGIDSYI